MSRKLIFVAGLLSCFSCEGLVALDGQTPVAEVLRVVEHLSRMVRKSPLDIIAGVVISEPGLHEAGRRLFGAYNDFLAVLDDPLLREELKTLPAEDADTNATYERIRRIAQEFEGALTDIFLDIDTPIARLTRRYGLF